MTMLETTTDTADAREVPLERLEAEIIDWSGNLAAATARLLDAVSEYDRREGWKSWGCRSAAHWLSWKCGESLHTAREKVRVARQLDELPLVAAAFRAGRLSYCKVRAVTRVATSADDDHWLDVALDSTGADLDRIVAGVRSALDKDENRDARTAFERRRVERCRRPDGLGEISLIAPRDLITTVWAAINSITSKMIDDAVEGSDSSRTLVIEERGGIAALRCDAMVQIFEQALAADPVAAQRGDVGRLQLVIDADALESMSELDECLPPADDAADQATDRGECTLGGARIAPEVARRWSCDIRSSVVVEHDGHVHDEGRSRRNPNRYLRRALHRRDRGACRFPGCGASSWLHAHHIVHWSDGGPTDLRNLVSLCGFHHHLVHEGGWSVELIDDTVIWSDPSGIPATVEPINGDASRVSDLGVPAGTLHPRSHSDRLDFAFVVSVITDNCRSCRSHE